MLKVRMIPTLLYKDFGLVKGVGFDSWRRVGTALPAIKVYNTRQVDELILLDIAATPQGRTIDFEEVDQLADECFMPLTVGGGIRTVEDIRRLLRAGADKVAINSSAVDHPSLISEAASRFGSQCIVVSIDYIRELDGKCAVTTHSGKRKTDRTPVEWARDVAALGAGEILLTSVERDGTMQGYDTEMLRAVTEAVDIPVIASGGAGTYEHMAAAILEGGASAIAAASIFHFTESTPLEAKRFLREKGIPVRV
jgi:cyclase